MSHGSLGDAVAFWFVALLVLLLVMSLYAVMRGPGEPASRPAEVAPEPPAPADLGEIPEPVRQRALWPPTATSEPSDLEYLPRHVTHGGPPWDPAPKPPDVIG
jgi:hypothetical protein